MLGFNIGLSALQSSQLAMDVIANNIANANTPGYHRQVANEVARSPFRRGGHWVGTGVEIANIGQVTSYVVESALTSSVSDLNQVNQSLNIARQVENLVAPSVGSIEERFQQFFDEFQQLQSQPDDITQRQIVIDKSTSLANEFNSVATGLIQLQRSQQQQIREEVNLLNEYLTELSRLNDDIGAAQAQGRNHNSLLDQHQQVVNRVAELIDIEVFPDETGFRYQFASSSISLKGSELAIEALFDEDGLVTFTRDNSDTSLEFAGGRLAGYQLAHNELVPRVQQQLDTLASTFIQAVNSIQSTGTALSGPHDVLLASQQVSDPGIPLNDAGLPFEVGQGELFVTVYDLSSGTQRQHSISIDGDSQSLQDIADAISNIPDIQAQIDPVTRSFSVFTGSGYGFDFSGQIPDEPDRTNVTGDAPITFSGVSELPENTTLDFSVKGSGTIGVTDNLQLVVNDGSGALPVVYDIGKDYEPGSSIDLGNGLFISLDSGTINDGDAFSVVAVADADEANFLSGIGLNSFFDGQQAHNIQVSEAIVQDPSLISAARSLNSGDGSNIANLLELRQQTIVNSEQTFEDHLGSITSGVAIEVNGLSFLQSDVSTLHEAILQERQSISGVDPNEEMIRMLQYQRSFQAATRVITTIDQTLAELMNIIR